MYYKLAKKSEIEKQKLILENKIDNYLKDRVKIRKFGDFNLLENMAIFKNSFLITSNFDVPKDINFKKSIWIKDNKIFYLKKLIRPFGEVYILTFKKLPEDNLIKHLMIFNIFILVFIICISLVLAKIFLAPMKQTIQNLEDFITDATHEMNTPISIIMTNIEILELKGIINKEFIRIKNGVKRLNKIFDDLKFISFNHTFNKKIETLNVKDILLQRIDYFEISGEFEIEDCFIKIDKEDLIRIIDNLLSNAKKYSKEYIKIELKKCSLLVKNDGEIKNLKNIKNKFVRENKNEGGFGIGLYIVDKICKNYKFKFNIDNIDKDVVIKIEFY